MAVKAKTKTSALKKKEPTKSTKKAPAAKRAPTKKTKPALPSTEFKVVAPHAKDVFLAGDFNNWNTSEYRMRRYKAGEYKKKLQLKAGSYQYLFLVDGHWWTDPDNGDRIPNPFGSENSVITVS